MATLIAGCIAAALGIGLLVYALLPKGQADTDAIDRRLDGDDSGRARKAPDAAPKLSTPQLMSAVKRAAPKIAAPMSDEDQSRLRAKLAAAGIRTATAPAVFLASKTVLLLVVGAATLITTWLTEQQPLHIAALTAFIGFFAFMLPDVYLAQIAAARVIRIKKGLADCLDMTVIMVEAGLGMDAAIQRVGLEMNDSYPDLAGEFRIATAEMNMGLPRNEALQNLADRTGVREIQTLVATIIQAERFGSSVGTTLRVQSDTVRTKRQQAAEEAAGKTAVKLLLPLILFIFPALMIVVGGPAAMRLMDNASNI